MLTEKNTSDKYKYCEFCGRTLPKHYEGTLCPTCQEAQLFRNVRDYIRANTVNEYEVAEHFHIPLRQIKEWIREGRRKILFISGILKMRHTEKRKRKSTGTDDRMCTKAV